MTPEQYLRNLPVFIRYNTKLDLVTDKYGLTEAEFQSTMRRVNATYQLTLRELFAEDDEKDY